MTADREGPSIIGLEKKKKELTCPVGMTKDQTRKPMSPIENRQP